MNSQPNQPASKRATKVEGHGMLHCAALSTDQNTFVVNGKYEVQEVQQGKPQKMHRPVFLHSASPVRSGGGSCRG